MIRKTCRKHVREEIKVYAKKMRLNPTQSEGILWEYLKKEGLGVKFRRQAIIYGWIVDFYSPKAELVIEVDGGYHLNQQEKDRARSNIIKKVGVKIMRFTNDEIINTPDKVISKIKEYIEQVCPTISRQ